MLGDLAVGEELAFGEDLAFDCADDDLLVKALSSSIRPLLYLAGSSILVSVRYRVSASREDILGFWQFLCRAILL